MQCSREAKPAKIPLHPAVRTESITTGRRPTRNPALARHPSCSGQTRLTRLSTVGFKVRAYGTRPIALCAVVTASDALAGACSVLVNRLHVWPPIDGI